MADYIEERGDAFDAVMGQFCACSDETEAALNGAIEDIRNIPAADVRVVVHARWVFVKKLPNCSIHKCSNCDAITAVMTRFCHNCGAMMDADMQEVQDGV